MARTTVKQQFWAKVALPDENECMRWLASGTGHGPRGGYGQFQVYGKRYMAHRFAAEHLDRWLHNRDMETWRPIVWLTRY